MLLDELQTLLESSPTSLDRLREKLQARLVLAGGPPRLVNEAELLAEILGDVEGVVAAQDDQWLDYAAASLASGYSTKQLQRFAEDGNVDTVGTHRNRRFRRGSLPIKPALRPQSPKPRDTPASTLTPPTLGTPRPSSLPSSTPVRAAVGGGPTTPVAVRRGHTYDPDADAQRFARLDASMRNSL